MKKVTIFILLGLIALFGVACGGSDTTENSEPENITLDFKGYDEFRYEPQSASVPTGAQVTVNFENTGTLEHNWLLISDRTDPLEATEADAIAGATSGEIAGGETATFTFTAPPPGSYKVVCTVPGHAAGGMVADFTVTE